MDFETSMDTYATSYPITEEVFIRTVMKFLVGDIEKDCDEFHCDVIDEAINEFENALRKAWGVDICEITMRDDEILERQKTFKQVQNTILENEYLSYKLKEDFLNFSKKF